MRLTYDPRYNIAYIRFQEKRADVETVRISDELVVDMAPDGTIYGNEDSPQQATGYQKENLIMMRNHGFSNSSL